MPVTAEQLFGISRPNLEDDLKAFYDEAEEALIRANPRLRQELRFSSTLPMHHLPFNVRSQLINKYRRTIGFDESLNSLARTGRGPVPAGIAGMEGVSAGRAREIGNIYNKLLTSMSPSSRNAFGRLPETSGSMLSSIYTKLNVQFRSNLRTDRAGLIDSSGKGALASSYFTLGLDSIPSRNSISRPQYTPGMLAGKSTMVYDIETAGLSKGQIREVAYTRTGANGVRSDPQQLLFTPKEFDRGMVAVDGRATSLRDFMASKFNMSMPRSTGGDEFANGMESFLREVMNTDYIVGHNISGFDNEQVFVGLSRTDRYGKDKKFRSLVDQAFEKINTSTIDTLALVREMPDLANIKTASEISRKGSRELFSISNLLLQTDLSDRIGLNTLADLMGHDGAGNFQFGLHHAGVDTAVTSAILDAAENGGLKLKRMGAGLTGNEADLAKMIRQQIGASSAITPFTNIGSVDQLTDPVLRRLIKDYNGKGALRAARGSELDILLRGKNPMDREVAFHKLRLGELAPSSIKLTPIEQQILSERNIAGGIDDVGVSAGDTLRRMKHMRPGGIYNFDEARASGLPFSGLSSEERRVAYGLSEATSSLSSLRGPEARMAGLASDTLVSRFDLFDANKVQYVTKSGRASMPVQLLQQAGVMKPNDMVSLSIVDPSARTDSGAVNVVKSLDSKSAAKLKTYLADLHGKDDATIARALGVDPANAKAAVEHFRQGMSDGLLDRLDTRGVSIAQVYGGDDPQAVSGIINTMRKFFNVEGQIDDRSTSKLLAPIMDVDTEAGVLRTVGLVFDTGVRKEEKAGIRAAVAASREVYSQTMDVTQDPMRYAKMKMMARMENTAADITRAHKVASEIIPHLGKGAAGIAAAGLVAVLFNRHKENKVLDETLEFQGYENSGEGSYGAYQQIQDRIATGYEGYSNRMDPLATASITNNLNNSRVAHSDYSWDRNNSIYGGLL